MIHGGWMYRHNESIELHVQEDEHPIINPNQDTKGHVDILTLKR